MEGVFRGSEEDNFPNIIATCLMMFQCCRGQQKHILSSLLARRETLMSRLATHFPTVQHDLSVIGPLADGSSDTLEIRGAEHNSIQGGETRRVGLDDRREAEAYG